MPKSHPTPLSINIGIALVGYMAVKALINQPGGDHGHHDKRSECTGCPALLDCPLLVPLELDHIHFTSDSNGGR